MNAEAKKKVCHWVRKEGNHGPRSRYWWTDCETMTKSRHGYYCHNCGRIIKAKYLPKRKQ